MHVRIVLLMLASVLFAAAWGSDRPPGEAPVVTSPGRDRGAAISFTIPAPPAPLGITMNK